MTRMGPKWYQSIFGAQELGFAAFLPSLTTVYQGFPLESSGTSVFRFPEQLRTSTALDCQRHCLCQDSLVATAVTTQTNTNQGNHCITKTRNS